MSSATTHIGIPASRVDGRAKVTGAAKYAAEYPADNLAYGALVSSRIAKGRIARMDTSEALAIEGVIDVLTHENRPRMARSKKAYEDDVAPGGTPFRPLYDDKVFYNAQPVALVLAEDWETARYAASLVRMEYDKEPHVADLETQRGEAFDTKKSPKPRGNAEKAFAAAEVQHEAEYWQPIEHHNPMEMHAATVIYQGDGKLTIYDKTQGVQNSQAYVANVFGLKPDDVRVISLFVGGAFGSGLRPQYHLPLAVMGALALKRSVRLVLTRQQMFTFGYRPGTIQRVALGAKSAGTLDAIMHDALAMTSQYENFTEHVTNWSSPLYKCANAKYGHKLARLDLATPIDMRAPGGATGMYALECAMDELAVALKLDPLELRFRCYSDRDQDSDIPFSSKKLRECYRQGADAFGWEKRNAEPRSMRDGSELVGWGMATGIWEAMQQEASARVVLTANGHAEVACAFTDIGPGTYTMMTQVAADRLGLPLENVAAKLGDSILPKSPVEGGSWTAASAGNAIALACEGVRKQLLRCAKKLPNSPLADEKPEDVALLDGKIVSREDSARAVSIADAMRAGNKERIEQEATAASNDDGKHARYTHSAIFAEIKVDEQLRVVRVTRIVNAVAAGRIINPKTARSQILGGVVFGMGMALHEETLVDHKLGRIVNHNLAEYHVPANADVHDIEVIFVDEPDEIINPLGVKGVGEIGVVGTAAAIANAIYHATGIRVRDLPITVDKILG
jgi:xanthine dehydrogenase YagR molybdenum-binding subunit